MCRDLGSCIILFDEVLMILPIWPFPGCGGRGGCGRYPRSGPRCVRAPPSGVCPAGGLQCALLVLVPVGAVGLSWPGGGLFWPVGGGGFAFRGLCCWWASVALCLWFRFWALSVIAIGGSFCQSQELGERAPPFEVYRAGRLQ